MLIKADGTYEKVTPKDEARGFSLPEIYALIGCKCIDVAFLRHGQIMVVDDEGERKELPANRAATLFYWEAGGPRYWWIRGDVLVGNKKEIQ
jgi:hypothetical protein